MHGHRFQGFSSEYAQPSSSSRESDERKAARDAEFQETGLCATERLVGPRTRTRAKIRILANPGHTSRLINLHCLGASSFDRSIEHRFCGAENVGTISRIAMERCLHNMHHLTATALRFLHHDFNLPHRRLWNFIISPSRFSKNTLLRRNPRAQ